MTKEKLDQVSVGIDRLGDQVINLTKENNALKFEIIKLKNILKNISDIIYDKKTITKE